MPARTHGASVPVFIPIRPTSKPRTQNQATRAATSPLAALTPRRPLLVSSTTPTMTLPSNTPLLGTKSAQARAPSRQTLAVDRAVR